MITSAEHRVVFSKKTYFQQRYTLMSKTQLDFLDSGVATFTCLEDGALCGFVSKIPFRLTPKSSYRVTIKGQALSSTTYPLIFAESDISPTRQRVLSLVPKGTPLLDRNDLLLPLVADESSPAGVTTILTNTSRYPAYAKFGIKFYEAKAGQEFRVEWIEIEKLESSLVTPHWRTVSDKTGFATSYYDHTLKQWKTASLLLKPTE